MLIRIPWGATVQEVLVSDSRIAKLEEPEAFNNGILGLLGISKINFAQIPLSGICLFDGDTHRLVGINFNIVSEESTCGDVFKVIQWLLTQKFGLPTVTHDKNRGDVMSNMEWISDNTSISLTLMVDPGIIAIFTMAYRPTQDINDINRNEMIPLEHIGDDSIDIYYSLISKTTGKHLPALGTSEQADFFGVAMSHVFARGR